MAGHEHLTHSRPRGRYRDIRSTAVLQDAGPRWARASSATPAAGQATGRYVYGIVETEHALDLGPIGIGEGRNPVYTLHFGDLAAVVSDTPLRLHEATRENLLAHELVNQTVLRDYTIIPMAFGTIFRSDDDVLELLRTTGKAFGDVLGQIRGKFEFGLKAIWQRERVVEGIESEHAGIRDLKKEITESGSGSTYFARLRLGRLIEAALESRAERYAGHIWKTLRPLSAASRALRPIGDSMILNGAFLVDRSSERDFDDAVEHLASTWADVLSLKYTGPWPPYNFVNIKLRLERAD